jgi:2-amino-4-hydroxy-6-hydroxymethyldihydropteridine diphosphokinase
MLPDSADKGGRRADHSITCGPLTFRLRYSFIRMPLAAIALGANIPGPAGPPQATLAAAAKRLASLGRIVARSSLYSTTPVGFRDQPRFVNAVVALETELSPRGLLEALLAIELYFGRDRAASPDNGPRTLDLDLLFYGDLVLSESGLEVPHPRLAERAFVLVPLHEIAPNLRDPRSGKSVAEILDALDGDAGPGAVVKIDWNGWSATAERG